MAEKQYQGKVTAPIIPIRFSRGGKVAWIKVKKGDRVKKGQALAGLNKKSLELQHKIELADYERERAEFEKLSRRIPKPTTDDEKTEKQIAQAKLDRAVKAVEKTQYELDQMTMISPVSGVVIEDSNLRAGMQISPASFEIEVAEMDKAVFKSKIELKTIREKGLVVGSKARLKLGKEESGTEVIWMGEVVEKGKLEVNFKLPTEGEFKLYEPGKIELD